MKRRIALALGVLVALAASAASIGVAPLYASHGSGVDGRTNLATWYQNPSIPSSWTTALGNGALVWDNVSSQCHDFVRQPYPNGQWFVWKNSNYDGREGVYAITPADHAAVMFDGAETWHLNVDASPGSGSLDLWSVAAHEFGHILSLAHAEFYGGPSTATMAGGSGSYYGQTWRRTLESYDQTHERNLYPTGSC